MQKLRILMFSFALCVLGFSFVYATPSTTYWTPDTMDVQPYGKWHVTYDSYFTVGRRGSEKGDLTTDVGLTVGALPFKKLNLELGFDLNEPLDEPLSFNGKFGTPEGSLFTGSPALNVGIFNVGTKKAVNDYNIFDFIVGKTLPFNLGRFHGGYYVGNANTLKSATGRKDNTGYMVAYDYGFHPVKDEKGEFNRLVLAADYASGKNAIGGGGVGMYFYFTRDIDLLMGPVWFNDQSLNGNMKWTMQLDINF